MLMNGWGGVAGSMHCNGLARSDLYILLAILGWDIWIMIPDFTSIPGFGLREFRILVSSKSMLRPAGTVHLRPEVSTSSCHVTYIPPLTF
jgi:hypothetical protein